MKIVHVEDTFHPDTGYQLNLLSKYMVAAGHQVTIITAKTEKLPKDFMSFFGSQNIVERDQEFTHRYGVKIIRIPTKGYYSGRVVLSKKFLNAIKNEKPDAVFIHGNDTLTAMRYLLHWKKMKYPLILDSHMLEMAAKNKLKKIFRKVYRMFFSPVIIKNKIPVIRTQDSDYVEKAFGIPLSQAPWISTGSDTMLFKPDMDVKSLMKQNNNITDDTFVVTYAGKLDEAKGGLFLANTLHKKIDAQKKICFVIIGNTTGDYGELVEKRFKESHNRILRYPTQKYADLASFFQMSDVVVFPKQCSLSFYDAQACGVPVIFEGNEINSKRACCNNALTFKSDDEDDFREKIIKMVDMPSNDFKQICDNAMNYVKDSYDYKKICDIYLDVIKKEVDRVKKE